MPYCSQCGSQVRDRDAYCTRCGARQPVAPPASLHATSDTVPDRTACILCYIPFVGWVVSIIVLAAARFREHRIVRFHAFQALYLFVAWLLVDRVAGPFVKLAFIRPLSHYGEFLWFPGFGISAVVHLLELALVLVSVYMMFRVNEREALRLPLLGDLAEKSL